MRGPQGDAVRDELAVPLEHAGRVVGAAARGAGDHEHEVARSARPAARPRRSRRRRRAARAGARRPRPQSRASDCSIGPSASATSPGASGVPAGRSSPPVGRIATAGAARHAQLGVAGDGRERDVVAREQASGRAAAHRPRCTSSPAARTFVPLAEGRSTSSPPPLSLAISTCATASKRSSTAARCRCAGSARARACRCRWRRRRPHSRPSRRSDAADWPRGRRAARPARGRAAASSGTRSAGSGARPARLGERGQPGVVGHGRARRRAASWRRESDPRGPRVHVEAAVAHEARRASSPRRRAASTARLEGAPTAHSTGMPGHRRLLDELERRTARDERDASCRAASRPPACGCR